MDGRAVFKDNGPKTRAEGHSMLCDPLRGIDGTT